MSSPVTSNQTLSSMRVATLAIAFWSFSSLGAVSVAVAQSNAQPTPAAVSASSVSANKSSAWAKLTPAQQTALAPLQQNWDSLSDAQRKKWVKLADDRYYQLDAAGKARAQSQMQAWANMTPEQRKTARENYNKARLLPPDARQAKVESFQRLDPQRKEKLAAQADAASKSGTNPAVQRKLSARASSGVAAAAASGVKPGSASPGAASAPQIQLKP